MIYPKKLKIGDKVGIIATSTPINNLKEDQIQRGYDFLRQKGFKIVEHPQCRYQNGYTAGTIAERVDAIHQLFSDTSIAGIMSFWGGTNTNQLLDTIDYELIKSNPKIMIGYSDTTALLQAITNKTDIITFLGPAVITFTKPELFPGTWSYFENFCMSDEKEIIIYEPDNYSNNLYFNRPDSKQIVKKNDGFLVYSHGNVEGQIVAGNLSVLMSLFGTPYFPDLKDKLLFMEMCEDDSAQIFDRMMTQCQQIGVFKYIKGLVISKFMEESDISHNMLINILKRVLRGVNVPVIYNFDCGHTDPIITIPNGAFGKIDTNTKSIIIFKK